MRVTRCRNVQSSHMTSLDPDAGSWSSVGTQTLEEPLYKVFTCPAVTWFMQICVCIQQVTLLTDGGLIKSSLLLTPPEQVAGKCRSEFLFCRTFRGQNMDLIRVFPGLWFIWTSCQMCSHKRHTGPVWIFFNLSHAEDGDWVSSTCSHLRAAQLDIQQLEFSLQQVKVLAY